MTDDRGANTTSANCSGPLSIGPNCWLVGHRNPASLLQCNTYLRILEGEGATVRVCVDPGSQFDYSVVESNIQQLIGDLSEVDLLTLNHQDPDVVGNTGAFCDANPTVGLMVSEDVWRLTQHLLFKPGTVQFANACRSSRAAMGAGHRWQVVPTPFCHFRGAMAFYDPESRTLFSGDFFGGLNQLGRVHLYAESDDWQGVAQFHQIYMPTREILRYAVRQIRALTPAVEVIAPQHGHVIVGDHVAEFLDRMQELLVGHDLLVFELDEKYLRQYGQLIADMIAWAKEIMGNSEALDRLRPELTEDGLERLLRVDATGVELLAEGYSVVAKVFARVAQGEPPEFINALRGMVLAGCSSRGLPVPPIGAGIEGAGNT
jgi:glyoxylase-like metal-dependent hydrolase (beta-lactamase superfamily II)